MAINENRQAAANVQQGGVTDYAKNPLQQKAKVRFEPQEEAPVAVEETKQMPEEKAPVSVEDIQAEPVQMASLPNANVMTDADPSAVLPQQTEQQPVQTAGLAKEIAKIFLPDTALPLLKTTDELKKDIEVRQDTVDPVITKPVEVVPLINEDFNPTKFLDELNDVADPLDGINKTRAGSALTSDSGINLEHFNFDAGSDAYEAIEIVARSLPEKTVVKNSKILADAKKAIADELGIVEDAIQGRLNLSPRNLVASRLLLATSAENIRRITQDLITEAGEVTKDNVKLLEWERAANIHRSLVLQVRNLRAESGRTLQANRIPVGSDIASVENALDSIGGAATTRAKIKMFNNLVDNPDIRQSNANKFLVNAQSAAGKTLDGLMEIYVHGMIALPGTTTKVLLGNLQHFVLQPWDDFMAGVIGQIGKREYTDNATIYAPLVRAAGWNSAFRDGLRAASQAFLTEAPVDAMGRLDYNRPPALSREQFSEKFRQDITGYFFAEAIHRFGQGVRFNTRLMTTVDAFTKTLVARGELNVAVFEHMQRLRQNPNMTNEQIIDEATRMLVDPKLTEAGANYEEIIKRVELMGQRATLTAPVGRTLGMIGQPWRLLDGTKISTKVLTIGGMAYNTFWRVTVNSFRETYRRSPLAPILPSWRADVAAGGARRDKAMGNLAFGSALMYQFFELGLNGTCTGAGVHGAKQRKHEKLGLKTTRPRFSCMFGLDENGNEVWRSYAGLEPFGGLIAMGVTAGEAYRYGSPEGQEWENMLAAIAMLPANYVGELPFSQGLTAVTGIFTSIADPDSKTEDIVKKFDRFAGRIADVPGNTIPFSAWRRWGERAVHPERSLTTYSMPTEDAPETTSPMFGILINSMNRFYSQTPGLSEDIPYLRSVVGNKMYHDANKPIEQMIFPFKKTIVETVAWEQEYLKLEKANGKAPFAFPAKNIAGVNLTAKQYDSLLEEINLSGVEYELNIAVDPNSKTATSKEYQEAWRQDPPETLTAHNILAGIYAEKKAIAIRNVFGWDTTKSGEPKLVTNAQGQVVAKYPDVGRKIADFYFTRKTLRQEPTGGKLDYE